MKKEVEPEELNLKVQEIIDAVYHKHTKHNSDVKNNKQYNTSYNNARDKWSVNDLYLKIKIELENYLRFSL
jgi:hypothetical protein